MVRLDEIAQAAGVSKTTVSRVLNNRGYISASTRNKIYAVISDLNYHSEKIAKSLLKHGSSTVGLVVADICYSYFSEIALKTEIELAKRGYRMILFNIVNSKKLNIDILDIFQKGPIDGIILCNYPLPESILEDEDLIPIVSIDRYLGHGISTVSCDTLSSGRIAAELLIRNGCKVILQTVGSGAINTPWNERHKTFTRVLEENGVKCYTHIRDLLKVSDFSYNRKVIGEQLDLHPEVDGYFANDISAAATLAEVIQRGKKVPENFKIISSDGSMITEITNPQITTIRQPIDRIATWAVDTLCKKINDPKLTSCDVQLGVDLIERGTTC
jgi:LacI family sucrose operon transcriptional repressor